MFEFPRGRTGTPGPGSTREQAHSMLARPEIGLLIWLSIGGHPPYFTQSAPAVNRTIGFPPCRYLLQNKCGFADKLAALSLSSQPLRSGALVVGRTTQMEGIANLKKIVVGLLYTEPWLRFLNPSQSHAQRPYTVQVPVFSSVAAQSLSCACFCIACL